MSNFILAILPVISVVALGRFLAWRSVLPPEGWRAIERLAYLVLLPALIILVLAEAEFDPSLWKLGVTLIGAQCLLGAISLLANLHAPSRGPAIGSIIQSNVRWSTFIALSLGGALYGDEGLALVAIAAAVMIPTANVLSVWGLTSHADKPSHERPHMLLNLARNPLIIACFIGGAFGFSGWVIPGPVESGLEFLAQATIGLGLLSAGAGVDLGALVRSGGRTLLWSLVRLFGLPALVVGIGFLFGLSGMPLAIAVICASAPTATTGFILARELGGDTALSANLIAVQTVLSAISMPLIWFAMNYSGLI